MRQHGIALIVILWVVALLSLLAVSFGLGVRREASLAVRRIQGTRLLAACEAAVHYAAYHLRLADSTERWRADGRLRAWRWDGIEVRLKVFSEAGKVDVNQADAPLLQAVLKLAGAEPDQARMLADAILDWRDGDQNRRLHGAEAPEYRAAGLPYVPANQLFGALEEVGMVLGMTPELTRRLLPWITLHGRRGIDPASAPAELLRALPGADPQTVEAYLQGRERGNPPPFPPVPGIPFVKGSGWIYAMQVEAHHQGHTASLQTTIQIQGGAIRYLQWRETPLPKSLFGAEANRPLSASSPAAMTR